MRTVLSLSLIFPSLSVDCWLTGCESVGVQCWVSTVHSVSPGRTRVWLPGSWQMVTGPERERESPDCTNTSHLTRRDHTTLETVSSPLNCLLIQQLPFQSSHLGHLLLAYLYVMMEEQHFGFRVISCQLSTFLVISCVYCVYHGIWPNSIIITIFQHYRNLGVSYTFQLKF